MLKNVQTIKISNRQLAFLLGRVCLLGGTDIQSKSGVTAYPGLYFLGIPWLHSRKSGLFGVGDDAAYVAEHIGARDTERVLVDLSTRGDHFARFSPPMPWSEWK